VIPQLFVRLKASKDFNTAFLGKITIDPKIVEMGDQGTTLMINDKKIRNSKIISWNC
jgi:hypothetical protein